MIEASHGLFHIPADVSCRGQRYRLEVVLIGCHLLVQCLHETLDVVDAILHLPGRKR